MPQRACIREVLCERLPTASSVNTASMGGTRALGPALWCSCLLFGLLLTAVRSEEEDSKLNTCEYDLVQLLLLPPDSMHVQALKQDLIRYIEDKLAEDEMVKRSLSSLARSGNLPVYFKRNVEALARAGYLRQDTDDSEFDYKRSIANLAKNGQLPNFQRTDEDSKRSIESLARNGGYHNKRELDELLEDLYDKRNIGSLARNFNLPSSGKRFLGSLARNGELRSFNRDEDDNKRNIASLMRNGKRNIASLMRSNNQPSGKRYIFDEFKRNIASVAKAMGSRYAGKRNVAAMLRQDSYLNGESKDYGDDAQPTKSDDITEEEKRNIASLKAQIKPKYKRSTNESGNARTKRQADYWQPNEEYPVPVYQNSNGNDYEDLMQYLAGQYQEPDKRFLGSVAKSGWFRPQVSERYRGPDKRHIGSLARLGWLPALRTARRFHRSGRSANDPLLDYRPNPSDGSAEDNAAFEDDSVVDSKRYLLLPAVDNILLRRLYGSAQPDHQAAL